ncbi:MAG TPA: NADH-quinone oxidoreductase subunit NuoH, partial [Polyangiaceae bacterium]|nr:NADH-quinone oxidoreductase subunit NuoH [Polyangiaceae bacterium]
MLARRVLLMALLVLWGCATRESVNLLDVIDVAPRDVEVGDTIEVLGTGLPSGNVPSATVIFEGQLLRPGQDAIAVEATCGPASHCIHITGAKPAPDKVTFTFTEGLQTQFCGAGDEAMHTTFRGDVIVEFPASAEGGQPVQGKVMNTTLDFRPPSARRMVMESRAKQGRQTLEFLGLAIDAEAAPPAGGLRIGDVRAQSPA